jgi:hypothetical protein
VLAVDGCASSSTSTPQARALERADLIDVYHTLTSVEPSVRSEAAATKLAWPHVFAGVPDHYSASARRTIDTAEQRANALTIPAIFQERTSASLTGPASGLAGEFRSFSVLAARGWKLLDADIEQVEHGSPAAVRFAHANVGLYIEAVYDAHFTLAEIGKQMRKAWEKLEGAPAFGTTLTLAQIEALAGVYSEPNFRLYPHTGVKLGS